MEKLTEISGDEFVKKVLSGERDFSGVSLKCFDLSTHESIQALQTCLTRENLLRFPLILSGSNFFGLDAHNLALPYLKGKEVDLRKANLGGTNLINSDFGGANLEGAYLRGANLQGAYLNGADLQKAYLNGADLQKAYLKGAYLQGAYLNGAYLEGANLEKADLQGADLRNTQNLKHAIKLGEAIFKGTIVTPKEKEIIERARDVVNLFDVRKN